MAMTQNKNPLIPRQKPNYFWPFNSAIEKLHLSEFLCASEYN